MKMKKIVSLGLAALMAFAAAVPAISVYTLVLTFTEPFSFSLRIIDQYLLI